MSAGLNNLYNQANQARTLGNGQPPNLANVPDRLLQSASPQELNLLRTTKTNATVSDNAAAKCRTYSGVEGLRQLQKDQANRSFYDSGCGWRYKGTAGLNPTTNQGAIGSQQGPLFGGSGQPDEVSGGTKWYWDLQQAERDITTNMCKNVTKCNQLKYLGQNADICGYCKTTGAVIPVEKVNGRFQARFRGESVLTCEPQDIVTAGTGQCPPTEGFSGDMAGSSTNTGMAVRGNLREAFSTRTSREGFNGGASLDDLDSCTPPLTRDCVVLAARMAGCSDKGSLIQSLTAAPAGQDYDAILQKKLAFTSYKQVANPNITNAVLKDGSAALTTALDDFGRLVKDSESPSEKLRLSARDLCLQAGAFTGEEGFKGDFFGLAKSMNVRQARGIEEFAGYNFCAEMTNTSVINETNLSCVQADWQKEGGTEKGTSFPQLSMWKGKTYQAYLDYTKDLFNRMRSTDKTTNAAALKEFIGVDSFATAAGTILPRDDTTRGAETVWIDLGNAPAGGVIPVIMKCDLMLAKNGEVYPKITRKEDTGKYRVPSDNIGFINAFEMRPEVATQVAFNVTTDDGFMIGYNQNPFEGTAYRNFDWGSWRYQGPTAYTSGLYNITGVKDNTKNVFVTKWFQGGGAAVFDMKQIYKAIPQYPPYDNFKRYNTGEMVTHEGANYRFNNFIGAAGYGIGYPNVWTKINSAPIDQVKDQANSFADRTDMYLTQEPLAPWMQYEICTRPNAGSGNAVGFFEKRWNGPIAYAYWTNAQLPSFDVVSGSVAYQTDKQRRQGVPGGKPYASFTSRSWWHTKAYFAFNAFKTITLLVRPEATPAVGSFLSIFHHVNFKGFSTGVYFTNNGGGNYVFHFWNGSRATQVKAYPNEWNFIVFQYASDEGGLRAVQFDAERLETLKQDGGRRSFLDRLRTKQNATGGYLVGNAASNRENSGYLIMGASVSEYVDSANRWSWRPDSFVGDIAWIHGFRTFLDTDDLLKAELTQSWISRWPRGNIDGEQPLNIDPKNYQMYGSWIGTPIPVKDITYLPDGRPILMIEHGPYTKMVTLDNAQAKYYVGNIGQFDASKWNAYGDATGNYLNKKSA
jgi:hypothetical protein